MAIGNALGGSSTSGTTSGQGALGGRGSNAAQRRRQRARARQRRQQNRGGGGGGGGAGGGTSGEAPMNPNGFTNSAVSSGSLPAPVTPGNTYGGNNPLDTGTGSNNFNDINNRRESALGLLHQAGIDSNASRAYGASAVPFLDDMVQGWLNDYEGVALTQNPDLTFENFLYGLPGADALAANAPAPGVVPGTQNWRNQTWNPAMNAAIRRALARRTPTQRQQDTTRWTGGNTTVAFG